MTRVLGRSRRDQLSELSRQSGPVGHNRDVDLTIATQPYDDATIVAPTGELDVHTAPHLREAVVAAERRGTDIDVIVDLSAVTFMDSTGLGVLVGALARSREDGHRLVLCGVSGRIRRLLELTGLQTEFELADSVSVARRA